MTINIAHLRERSPSGGWIDFVVFDADSTNRNDSARSELLSQLTRKARLSGLKVDKAALAFVENGKLKFFGPDDLIKYLSNHGVPNWTHTINV